MILIVTNRQDQTADFLIIELKKRNVDYIRFNTEDFPKNIFMNWRLKDGLLDGYLNFPKKRIELKEISSTWYRRPVSPILDSSSVGIETKNFIVEESQTALDGLWKTLTCFWVSNPDKIRIAENKLYQLKVAIEAGFKVWPTLVTTDVDSAKEFYRENRGDVIYKPLRKGRLIRENKQSFIFTNLVDNGAVIDFDNIRYAPCLFQKYIHKSAELRITVIGNKVFTVEIVSQSTPDALHDWRRGLPGTLVHRPFILSPDVEQKCKKLVRLLGLEFGALDLIITPEGEPVFVEINPNGQWAWIQQLLPEIPMRETLADLLICGQTLDG